MRVGRIFPTFLVSAILFQSTNGQIIKNYPITRDTLGIYPDSLVVIGGLIDYSLAFSCGVWCSCGALKIRVEQNMGGYDQENVFVAVPCMISLPPEFLKLRKWIFYKIKSDDNRCYWTELPINKFDTKGIPFYTLTKWHRPK
jgi:hypothetical protein